MKSVSLASPRHLTGTPKPGVLDKFARRLVLRQLEQIRIGTLTLKDHGETLHFGELCTHLRKTGHVHPETSSDYSPQTFGQDSLSATIEVLDPSFYAEIAFGGSIGAGEAYMRSAWCCDDAVQLVRILLRNRQVLDGMEGGLVLLTRPLQKLFHWVNRNTRKGARRNISAHYDVGNDFFALWLDETMMYSSAIFEHENQSLADAQKHRLDAICQRLELGPDDHVIEIGTGWGGFAIHAVRNYGCRVTTTTISREQHELAARRIREAGLADRIELLLEDYRDLQGAYDKLVSVEMIEAIGSAQYDTYFRKCSDLLKPGGRMLIQAITIADQQYAYAQKNVDFIQRYIFPGAGLPCLSVMVGTIVRVSDMLVTGVYDIGLDYARTLNHWRGNFISRIDEVRALGYPEEFIRMWDFYLVYCEGGFLERAISDVHLVAEKPG